MIDDRAGWHHQDEVLAEKVEDPLRHIAIGHPDGGVFGHGELTVKDGDVDIGQCVRRINSDGIDVWRPDTRDERGDFLCR